MSLPTTIQEYLTVYAKELGERILQSFPPLQSTDDSISPHLDKLLRKPFPAQSLAIMGVVKKWQIARSAAVVAECGTGKTLIALAAMHAHSEGGPYTSIAMVPPHLTEKWAREAFQTIPGIRVFMIDGFRDASENRIHGVNEVKLRRGRIIREGLHTTLSELRLRKNYATARSRWQHIIGNKPTLFVLGRDRAKLGYFWRHAYRLPRSGPFVGCVVNPDTGIPIYTNEGQIRKSDFKKVRLSELVNGTNSTGEVHADGRARRTLYSPLWQADSRKIRRIAPLDFIGRYMQQWFDYALCDEAHQLAAGDTAQGNGLGTLAASAKHVAILTGTLLGGFADDVYHILFRLDAGKMVSRGYSWGGSGVMAFTQDYGVLETITTVQPADNACSKARTSTQVKRRPGASPLLFGDYLLDLASFVSLDDISGELPPFSEEVISVPMDTPLRLAYQKLEEDVTKAFKEYYGNHSVLSTGLNALLLYPDRPFGLGDLTGIVYNPKIDRHERVVISSTIDLDRTVLQAKERRLIAEVKAELAQGNRCHIYAVYTRKRDVTRRLEQILRNEGINVAVLTADVPTDKREAWFEKRLAEGVQVTISHPKIIETGIDLISHNCLIFYETGYSLHTLRQASRRSWRIGQRKPVRVLYLHYENTMQTACLRLMGKKLLVSLAMEGKFTGDGLEGLNDDGDMLTAMAKELVREGGIGASADTIWRQLREQTAKREPEQRLDKTVDSDAVEGETDLSAVPSVLLLPSPEQVPAVLDVIRDEEKVRIEQLSLF